MKKEQTKNPKKLSIEDAVALMGIVHDKKLKKKKKKR